MDKEIEKTFRLKATGVPENLVVFLGALKDTPIDIKVYLCHYNKK